MIGGGTTAVAALFEDWARGIPALALEVGQHPGRLGHPPTALTTPFHFSTHVSRSGPESPSWSGATACTSGPNSPSEEYP